MAAKNGNEAGDSLPCYESLDPDLVLKEIFESPQNELRDEINVPMDQQDAPILMGLIRDLDHGGRCGLDFLIRIKFDKKTVEER